MKDTQDPEVEYRRAVRAARVRTLIGVGASALLLGVLVSGWMGWGLLRAYVMLDLNGYREISVWTVDPFTVGFKAQRRTVEGEVVEISNCTGQFEIGARITKFEGCTSVRARR